MIALLRLADPRRFIGRGVSVLRLDRRALHVSQRRSEA